MNQLNIPGYIEEELPIETEPLRKAHTLGNYSNNERQQIFFEYEGFWGRHILYNARPSCEHEIQAQLSGGIRCIKCGGWYCY